MTPTTREDLATMCLTHLQAEEKTLEQLEAVLLSNRQALVEHNAGTLNDTGQQLQSHQNVSVAMGDRRRRLQKTLGKQLGIAPERVTLSRFIDDAHGEARERITETQLRLQETVVRLNRLLHGNLMIATQRNLIIERTLESLMGGTNQQRYGASGHLHSHQTASSFETET